MSMRKSNLISSKSELEQTFKKNSIDILKSFANKNPEEKKKSLD